MNTAPARPRGRRPGHDDTRGTIRAAAARLFAESGYDRVSLRAIAREAGVDPALVHHYFGSKADLFCRAALGVERDVAAHVEQILAGDREQIGRRVVRSFFDEWDVGNRHEEYLVTLSQDAPRGSRALTEMLAREVFAPIAASFGHSNAVYRGQLAASAMLGVMVSRHLLDLPVLASLSLKALANPLGRTLQYYLVDTW